jgi:hypothetical protein
MMAPEIALAERRHEVRRAARAWAAAGFLGPESHGAITEAYPDDRTRLPAGFRILAFILTFVAITGSFGFLLLIGDGGGERAVATLAAVFAALCAVATEMQRGWLRRADAGAELATALLTLIFAALGLWLWAGLSNAPATISLGVLALAGLVLAARWGSGVLGLLAAVLVLVWLAQFGAARLLWILVGAACVVPLLAGSRSPALAPTQRLGCWLAAGTMVLAVYLSVNLLSLDRGWVEDLHLDPAVATGWSVPAVRPVAVAATALLPLLLLGAGWRRRESLLVVAGLAGLVASAATLNHYWPLLPEAYLLLLAGLVTLSATLGCRRWLRGGPGGERQGWTADALFTGGNRPDAVRDVIGAVVFSPAAAAAGPPERPGEGRFGGGGATGSY